MRGRKWKALTAEGAALLRHFWRSDHGRDGGSIAAFWRSITAEMVVLSPRFGVQITPAVCRTAPNRTACGRFRFYSAVGRNRHLYVLKCCTVIRLRWFTSGLCVSCRRSRRGTESAARVSALLRKHIGLAMFSAGSTLGLRAPDCAKEPLALWTLFF